MRRPLTGARVEGAAGQGAAAADRARALDEHRRALAACRRCPLPAACARPIVSQAVAPRAMLIGQAPGRTEVEDGRPFAGRAGR
ncbi:MAG: uracil-DNA glycosylase family protein, partial [Gemmatimonadaceae bacterium]